MRLKQRPAPPSRIALARRAQRGTNLRRMMGVVVDDDRAAVVAEDLEAAVDAEELRERAGDRLMLDAELAADGDRGERVADLVLAGNEELVERAADFERRAAIVEAQVLRVARVIANDALAHARVEQARDDRVVGASDYESAVAHVTQEDAERFDDRLERAVVLEVIRLDVRDDGDVGAELMERAVVLVGFDDERIAFAGARVRAEVRAGKGDT